jgi:hypothetical protein
MFQIKEVVFELNSIIQHSKRTKYSILYKKNNFYDILTEKIYGRVNIFLANAFSACKYTIQDCLVGESELNSRQGQGPDRLCRSVNLLSIGHRKFF